MTKKREKRRNCADRLRGEVLTRNIVRRKRTDPAFSFAMQLLALVSFTINLFPRLPAFRQAAAAPLPEPPRPVPMPPPAPSPRSYKARPSWPMLMRDLARPVAHEVARVELYARLPVEVRPWLDHVVKDADWSAIRPFARSGATDEEVSVGVLAAFRAWKAEQDDKARKRKKEASGGKAGSSSKPGGGDDDPDEDDDKRPAGPK